MADPTATKEALEVALGFLAAIYAKRYCCDGEDAARRLARVTVSAQHRFVRLMNRHAARRTLTSGPGDVANRRRDHLRIAVLERRLEEGGDLLVVGQCSDRVPLRGGSGSRFLPMSLSWRF